MQCLGQRAALALGLAFDAKESSQAVHLFINGLESRKLEEEFGQSKMLCSLKILRVGSQERTNFSLIAILADDLSAKGDEVVVDDTDDVEAICDDAGIWKPLFDDGAVSTTEIDADYFYSLPPLKAG